VNSLNRINVRFLIAAWLITAALAFVAWDLLGRTNSGRFLVSRPELVLNYAVGNFSAAARSFGWTFLESTIGLIIAVVVAMSFGMTAVFKPALTRLAQPMLITSQVIPFVCLAPLIILIFGAGPNGKAFLSALMCFFPITTSILTGIRHAPRSHLELMRMMGASKMLICRHVIVPFATSHFFSGLRVAAPGAVVGAIVAEFNGADAGIGKDLFISAKRLEPEMMMLALFCGAICSALLYGFVLLAESFLGRWYQHSKQHEL